MRALRIEDVEAVPWPGGISWHSVRMELGLRAFGAAGYSGDPGDTVVEPHRESTDGRGHEELYVVLSGAATFALAARRRSRSRAASRTASRCSRRRSAAPTRPPARCASRSSQH